MRGLCWITVWIAVVTAENQWSAKKWSAKWKKRNDPSRCRNVSGETCNWLSRFDGVETRCTFTVRPGLCRLEDGDCDGPALKLMIRGKEILVAPHNASAMEPLLCEFGQGDLALVMVSNSFRYIFRPSQGRNQYFGKKKPSVSGV